MAEVRWRHDGRRLLMPIAVFPSDIAANSLESFVVEALLDTGATGTGVRPDVALKLNIPGRGKRLVGTANGDMLVPEHRIRLGFFAGSFDHLPIAASFPTVLEFGVQAHALRPNFGYGLLMGMDVLSQCDLTLRRDRLAILRLP